MRKCLLNNSVRLAFLFSVLTFSSCSVHASDIKFIGFFPGEGVKAYTGSSWKSYSEGLPADLVAEYITADSKGTLYLTTEFSGIFRRTASSDKWENIATSDLRRRTQLADVHEFRKVSSFCIDPDNNNRLYAGTKHALYRSDDAGKTWTRVEIRNNRNSFYFTSLMIIKGVIYAGTSFDGILRIESGKAEQINNGIPKEYYAGTLNFCEGVSALANAKGTLYSGYLFARGIAETADGKKWTQIQIPFKKPTTESVYGIIPAGEKVYITTDESIYEYSTAGKKVRESGIVASMPDGMNEKGPAAYYAVASDKNPAMFVRRNILKYEKEAAKPAGNKQAVYVSWSMLNSNFKGFLDIVVRTRTNAVVIDVKDDWGIINAPVENKVAKEIGAVRNTNIKEIIAKLHEKGVYVIARNVTFKDKKLYAAYNSKYAIWDKYANTAWVGLPRERWCDPYSDFVRQYNIDVAKETAKLGFDEIQFDYIRFPSDGPTGKCLFRYKTNDDTFKSEILGDFLAQAKREISIPVSIDIYGYNGWYRFGNNIGQDIEFFSRFIDVICPMVYPSHFGGKFYSQYPVPERPYFIVRDSTFRGIYLSHGRIVLRPWIQGWNYLSPTWGPDYILKQIKAVKDGGGSSYTFWNPKGDHSMLDRTLGGKK